MYTPALDTNVFFLLCVCRCIRWYKAYAVKGKTSEELVAALGQWVTCHSPMKELTVDGKRGIIISEATKRSESKGVHTWKRALRAVSQTTSAW